jgi:hypothetical protein
MDDDAKKEAALNKAMAAFDWLVRVYAPAFLQMANLEEHAKTLAGMPEIVSIEQIDSHVSVRVKKISEGMKKRRKELRSEPPPSPLPEDLPMERPLPFMLEDRIWPLITKCFNAAEIPGYMHSVATDVATIADGAAKIAVASGAVTAENVHEIESVLKQQLAARLNSAS